MALSKTGRFLSKAEILGVGGLFPSSKFVSETLVLQEAPEKTFDYKEYSVSGAFPRSARAVTVFCMLRPPAEGGNTTFPLATMDGSGSLCLSFSSLSRPP